MSSSAGTVLITGAGGHLGPPMARSLADRSVALVLNDIDGEAVERVAGSIDNAVAVPADVSDPEAAAWLVADVFDRVGPVDVLVNAAGIEGPISPIEDVGDEAVKRVFDVNVMSVFWLCRAVVPAMKERRAGRIVNIASGAGLAGGAWASPYHASKHAVVGLTRSLARELAPHGVAVNAVCPGYVESPMVERISAREEAITGLAPDIARAVPMGRMADAAEVAATVAFLALDAPIYMTGSTLVLDGGLRA